ncbi:MAG: glycyl-radical enzyme activating protein [Clostridiales Family XIII bacterium]|jgi:pyruvate formate lyase activating enzyme|nr:glycyl-radical enzyme activating protein [Clostridiales Family XIII bacterium]
MEQAVVTNIQGYSIHDGPGIRTAVFLKGCSLRCAWCANPENLSPAPELGFIKTLCVGCGRCLGVCNFGAIVRGDAYRIDREKCRTCFVCADDCAGGALVRYGERMTSGAVFEKLRRDKMFFDASGGGVTFSGGEPLLSPGFVRELCESLAADGIDACIETCGCAPWSAFEAVLPKARRFLFDLKLMDGETHAAYTGKPNAQILENARRLVARGAAVTFRRPLIPGINDGEEETERTAVFLKSIGVPALELMPYHRLGRSKYDAINAPYKLKQLPVPPPERVNAVRDGYTACGIACIVSR